MRNVLHGYGHSVQHTAQIISNGSSSSSLVILPNVPRGTNRAGMWCADVVGAGREELILVALFNKMVMGCSLERIFILD